MPMSCISLANRCIGPFVVPGFLWIRRDHLLPTSEEKLFSSGFQTKLVRGCYVMYKEGREKVCLGVTPGHK